MKTHCRDVKKRANLKCHNLSVFSDWGVVTVP